MRAVLDTNVVISATLIRGGNEDRILRAWRRGAFELVLSPQILEEMGRALFYGKLQRLQWLREEEIISLLQALAQESVLVSGRVRVAASRDPEDNKFLAAAIEGQARHVVTGDKDLLAVQTYRGIRLITPAAFIRILRRAG
ncbi:MAG: putative toxin-antitoxin system toxin component, PIN family [Candidatus Methylomirabilales bacterium]